MGSVRQLLALSALLAAAACANAARPVPRHVAGAVKLDTALVRRACLAGDATVGADSLAALARSGCLLRDQRAPIRVY